MSTIIELIITFVLYFLVCLAAALPIAIFHTRKMDKLMSNYFREIDESCAALNKSQDESRAQVDEIHESADEMSKSFDEIHQYIEEIHESLDKMNESFDRIDVRLDRLVEFKRLMRDYSNLKIKRIEARENFCESQFWDEKNIH